MRFKIEIDAHIEAEDILDAFAKLAAHFQLLNQDGDPGITFVGRAEIRPDPAPRVHEVSIADGIGMAER